jgi:murein DD-endopeptidase MepM/ murein hydrolase activator NlpD
MHQGVDFAASKGTPVYAAGDGTIVKMGPFSTYGNYVRVRHRAGLDTAYAHMKGFKSGLRAGSRVKQGDIIGYVGTTGRSTGPHLHYEVIVAGAQVNPASIKLPTGRALKGKTLKSFQRVVAQNKTKFNALSRPTAVADNVLPKRKPEMVARN